MKDRNTAVFLSFKKCRPTLFIWKQEWLKQEAQLMLTTGAMRLAVS